MNQRTLITIQLIAVLLFSSCGDQKKEVVKLEPALEIAEIQNKVDEYTRVELSSDLINDLSDNQRKMISYFFEAGQIIDDLYWKQTWGDKNLLLSSIDNQAVKDFILINYGPWERLNDNKSFIKGIGEKPAGVNFYPAEMTDEDFGAMEAKDKSSLYTVIRRNADESLSSVPYHKEYKEGLERVSELLLKAAELAEDEGFKKYLKLRAEALLSGDYLDSDMAWMDMKTNTMDLVIGPIENYEDARYGFKAAFESFILLKDMDWSKKLERFSALLPELQTMLPVAEEYKTEVPGSGSDMGVYEAIYYAGDCNAGSKTIAINLPNDERVHIEKGSRKLQLKNSMRYKFDKILIPIADLLITKDQRKHIKFNAFFENTMFHEVGHGLGIKNTINGKGVVRKALKEQYSALEEGKADILGLFLVGKLAEMGELGEKDLMDNYVTFMAGIFRSVRFGAASSHGKANMVRFNYFQEKGAFTRDEETGTYSVNFEKMQAAMNSLANQILVIQGNGDYDAAKEMVESMGLINETLQADLDRISEAGIPRDIRFIQGKEVAGL